MASAAHKSLKMATPATPSRMSKLTTSVTTGALSDHIKPILVCGATATVFLIMILQGPPMIPTGGKLVAVDKTTLEPLNRPVIPGDTVRVSWNQDWKNLCSIKITPRLIGSDQTPKPQQPYILNPPNTPGARSESEAKRYFNFPYIAPGPATYSAVLQPNCFIDNIYQREFVTANVNFTVGAISPKQEQQKPQKPPSPPTISQHK